MPVRASHRYVPKVASLASEGVVGLASPLRGPGPILEVLGLFSAYGAYAPPLVAGEKGSLAFLLAGSWLAG